MKHKYRLVIGDWSQDGHNHYNYYLFECTHDQQDIKKAYLAACAKAGVDIHSDGRNRGCLCEYEDSTLSLEDIEKLKAVGVNFDKIDADYGEIEGDLSFAWDNVAQLFLEMVKSQLDGFEYQRCDEAPVINGFWSKDFNYSLGYGCYD